MDRILLVIDNGFLAGFNRTFGQIDLVRMKEFFENKYGKIELSYMYTSYCAPAADSFYMWVQSALRTKVVRCAQKTKECPRCGNSFSVEKGVDVSMAVKIIRLAVLNRYDTLIFVNGDGDLESALSYIKEDLGKRIILAGDIDSISSETKALAYDVVDFGSNELLDQLLKKEVVAAVQ